MAKELPEVWCDRCANPADRVVTTMAGDNVLCKKHADDLEYKMYAPAFRARAK